MKKLLNVGGNSKKIKLPPQYDHYEHILLDIDPSGDPDIVCDARDLQDLEAAQFDSIYCSHNLEHYYRHDVPKVLNGMHHVLREGGSLHVRVPDIAAVMKAAIDNQLELEDTLYMSPSGPIMVLDVIYGYSKKLEQSGEDYYAHKTGFTQKSLLDAFEKAGFGHSLSILGDYEVNAVTFKGIPDESISCLFNLPDS